MTYYLDGYHCHLSSNEARRPHTKSFKVPPTANPVEFTATMAPSKPTIITVHGTYHGPDHFGPLSENLQQHGYETIVPKLPATHYQELGAPPAQRGRRRRRGDPLRIQSTLKSHPDLDVVLLTHSYGGVVAQCAIEPLDKNSRAANGHSNGVIALLDIAAMHVPAGLSGSDLNAHPDGEGSAMTLSKIPNPLDSSQEVEVARPRDPPGPAELFYADMPQKEAEHWVSRLKDHHVWACYYSKMCPSPGIKWCLYIILQRGRIRVSRFKHSR